MSNEKQEKERKNKTFIFRGTEEDDALLHRLSYQLDKSQSEIMRQALRVYYYSMKNQGK